MSYLLTPASPAYRMSSSRNIITKASNYIIQPDDYMIVVTVTATITLPSAVGMQGARYIIKNAGVKNTTVMAQAGQTIDGLPTRIVGGLYDFVDVISDNQNWLTC